MPDTLHMSIWAHLILIPSLFGKNHYYPHFIDKKIEAQNCHRASIGQTQRIWFQIPSSWQPHSIASQKRDEDKSLPTLCLHSRVERAQKSSGRAIMHCWIMLSARKKKAMSQMLTCCVSLGKLLYSSEPIFLSAKSRSLLYAHSPAQAVGRIKMS